MDLGTVPPLVCVRERLYVSMQPRGVSTVIGTPRPREEAAVAGEVEAAAAAGDGEAAADDEAGAVRGRCAAE